MRRQIRLKGSPGSVEAGPASLPSSRCDTQATEAPSSKSMTKEHDSNDKARQVSLQLECSKARLPRRPFLGKKRRRLGENKAW